MAQDNSSKVFLELKDANALKFYEFSEEKLDIIRTYCLQHGSLIINKKNIYNKNIVDKSLWQILFYLEYIFVEKIIYGKLYCDVFFRRKIFV